MPSVSVVVPVLIKTDKQLAMTMRCLDLARKHTKIPFELVIVETNSQYLIDEADTYVYEKASNPTPEHGHNLGFKVASGDFIALLTNDVFVTEGWLESLLSCFRITDCGLATVATTQFNHKKEEKIEEGIWFSVAMIPRFIFDKVGYYDERFVNSWCDTDLIVRVYKEGYRMYQNFNCVVEHTPGQTVYQKPEFQKNYQDGRKLFYEKHKDCGLPIFEALK